MATFDERAREWDTPERSERAEVIAAAIRANVPLTPTTRTIDIGAGTLIPRPAASNFCSRCFPNRS